MEQNNLNKRRKAKNTGSKSANFATAPKTEDIALIETALVKQTEEKEVTDEEIQNMVVYENGLTSIDFMMPEDERRILEENVNVFSNVEETQKILIEARKNKKLSEDIKSLEIISELTGFELKGLQTLNKQEIFDAIEKDIERKFEEGSPAKALKEAATAVKILADLRQDLIKSLNPQKSGKNARIALKFENESGESFQLGVDV